MRSGTVRMNGVLLLLGKYPKREKVSTVTSGSRFSDWYGLECGLAIAYLLRLRIQPEIKPIFITSLWVSAYPFGFCAKRVQNPAIPTRGFLFFTLVLRAPSIPLFSAEWVGYQ